MRIFRIKSPFTNTHYEVVIQKKQYSNGRPALILLDFEDGSPYAVATVNLPELNLEDNQTFVKSYSFVAAFVETFKQQCQVLFGRVHVLSLDKLSEVI